MLFMCCFYQYGIELTIALGSCILSLPLVINVGNEGEVQYEKEFNERANCRNNTKFDA